MFFAWRVGNKASEDFSLLPNLHSSPTQFDGVCWMCLKLGIPIEQYDFTEEDGDMFRQTLFRDFKGFCQFPPVVPAEFLQSGLLQVAGGL